MDRLFFVKKKKRRLLEEEAERDMMPAKSKIKIRK